MYLCIPLCGTLLILLDAGDSSSLLQDPVPAHLAAPPRQALRGRAEDRPEVRRRTCKGLCSSSSSRWRPCRARRRGCPFLEGLPHRRRRRDRGGEGEGRGEEVAKMAIGEPADAEVARGGHHARSALLLPRRQRRKIRRPAASSPPAAAASSSPLAS